jgi:hypothetical protein
VWFPSWGSLVLGSLGGFIPSQTAQLWARLFFSDLNRSVESTTDKKARVPLERGVSSKAKAKAWHGTNRVTSTQLGMRNRCFWEMVWSGVRRLGFELNYSRFLFRHGSGTDVCLV